MILLFWVVPLVRATNRDSPAPVRRVPILVSIGRWLSRIRRPLAVRNPAISWHWSNLCETVRPVVRAHCDCIYWIIWDRLTTSLAMPTTTTSTTYAADYRYCFSLDWHFRQPHRHPLNRLHEALSLLWMTSYRHCHRRLLRSHHLQMKLKENDNKIPSHEHLVQMHSLCAWHQNTYLYWPAVDLFVV